MFVIQVVPRFKKDARSNYRGLHSNFVQKGNLDNKLFLSPYKSILGEVAVVSVLATRLQCGQLTTSASFFGVHNREYWLEWFQGKINNIHGDDLVPLADNAEEDTMEEDCDEDKETFTDR